MTLVEMLEKEGFIVLPYVSDEYVGVYIETGNYYVDVEFYPAEGYVLSCPEDGLRGEEFSQPTDQDLISALRRIRDGQVHNECG